MTDKNPLPTVAGRRTEGDILASPVKRLPGTKSPWLRALERKQREAAKLGGFRRIFVPMAGAWRPAKQNGAAQCFTKSAT